MWLWLLTLLFDPTVTTENTRCLTISGRRRTASPLLAVVAHQHMTSLSDIRENGIFFFIGNRTASHHFLLIGYMWSRMFWSWFIPHSLFTSLTITIIKLLCFTEREPTAKGVEVIQRGTTLKQPVFFFFSFLNLPGNSWDMLSAQWTAHRIQLLTSNLKLR